MRFVRPLKGKELEKMNQCREYLRAAGVFDEDSFTDYIEEENE